MRRRRKLLAAEAIAHPMQAVDERWAANPISRRVPKRKKPWPGGLLRRRPARAWVRTRQLSIFKAALARVLIQMLRLWLQYQ